MNAYVKVIVVLLVLCTGVFAQEINFNFTSEENPLERYEHFTRMKRTGTGLIIGGTVLHGTGIAVAMLGLVFALSADGGFGMFWAGAACSTIGSGMWISGIPIRVVGRNRAAGYKSMIPTAYVSAQSVNLVWDF